MRALSIIKNIPELFPADRNSCARFRTSQN